MHAQEALVRLDKWDFTPIRKYAVAKGVYPAEKVNDVEREYKRFIALCATGRINTMSRELDDFWHCHVLFSKNYTQMCHWLGVPYIHHNPCETEEDRLNLADGYKETLEFYKQQFGLFPDAILWPVDGQICCGGGHCDNREIVN